MTKIVTAQGHPGSQPVSQPHADMQAAARLRQMLFGAGLTQAISVIAELGIPDILERGPLSCAELAAILGMHEATLFRVLRLLAGEGVLTQDDQERFGLTTIGNLLRTDCVGSQRSSAIMKGSAWEWAAWGSLRDSVRDGRTAFSHAHGTGLFDYLDHNPIAAAIFQNMMTGLTSAKCDPLLDAYDFSEVGTYADVGGGQGVLMARVLAAYPEMRGIVFDLPSVVGEARRRLDLAGVADRCSLVGGSFFDSVPRNADLYSLHSVLLNWGDQDAERILRACRKAMQARGRLIVIDWIMPSGSGPHPSKNLDLQMLTLFGGRQRTSHEWTGLLTRSGFTLSRVIDTAAGFSVIEATPMIDAISSA